MCKISMLLYNYTNAANLPSTSLPNADPVIQTQQQFIREELMKTTL